MKPVISMNVRGEQGNDAEIVLSCQRIAQVTLPMDTQDTIREWLSDVFNGNAANCRLEVYEDGSAAGD